MAHDIEILICENLLEFIPVGEIEFRKAAALFALDDLIQQDFVDVESAQSEARQFQPDVVVGVEVVDAQDIVSGSAQRQKRMKPDKTCRTRYKYFHLKAPIRSVVGA